MKNKHILTIGIILVGLVLSCTDEDTYPVDFDLINNSNGGILKQVVQTSVVFDKTDIPGSSYQVTIEANDRDRGRLFTKVELFVSFIDRTPANGNDTKAEVKVTEYLSTAFVPDAITDLPRVTITHTATAAMTLLGLTALDVDGSDQFFYRQAMHFPDGNIYTSSNVNTAIASTGGVYKSPFGNIVAVVCPSDIGGTITYSTINGIAAGGPAGCTEPVTGTTTFTQDSPGKYDIGDGSFGIFDCAYGDTPSVGQTLNDACEILSITGTDQYGDAYTWSLVSNNGTQLVIDWISTYPDGGRTTLTRTGGWPLTLSIP